MEFRLLIPSTSTSDATARDRPQSSDTLQNPILSLEEREWTLSDPLNTEDEHVPHYTCISYLWGPNRETHALFSDYEMSSRSLPSLTSAVKVRNQCEAFWTDVFCVPRADGATRQATLENMGHIYAKATEVIIVLGAETFPAMKEMLDKGVIAEPLLRTLERDEWVSSVWTYQEIVNAACVTFVSASEDYDDPLSIDGSSFFSALGYSLTRHQKSSDNITPFTIVQNFPNLNVLENVLADWQTAAYTYRSALSVFSNISCKRNASPANYFYASFGALTHSPQQLVWTEDRPGKNLAEKLIEICESKNDFSFIYSVAEREDDPRRRWCPRADPLPSAGETVPAILRPIFAWHSWGEAQSGSFDNSGRLQLHHMTVVHPAADFRMSVDARRSIIKWLGPPQLPESMSDAGLAEITYASIRSVGFEGSPNPIVLEDGLVFTQRSLSDDKVVRIILSNEIRFPMGSPGLVQVGSHGDGEQYISCLFIGSILQLRTDGESVSL